MGCVRTLCEDFLRLVSLAYLLAGGLLIWGAWSTSDLSSPKELLHISRYWFPDTVATFGALLTLIGLVSSIGAWLQWAGPVSWSAGANFVLLLLEVVSFLSFVFDRAAFTAAGHGDNTGALAGALRWIEDNHTLFFVLLYIAFGAQALSTLAGSSYGVCFSRASHPHSRHSRTGQGDTFWQGREQYEPLLPGHSSPPLAGQRTGDRRKANLVHSSMPLQQHSSNA